MEHDFWHQKWSEGRIGFHQADINPYLKSFWQALDLEGEGRVFVPLCGKSKDMLWLREQGHEVFGVELNASACEAFFEENDAEAVVTKTEEFVSRSIDGIELLCGDYFRLTKQDIGNVSAVYDRAALIALPAEMRVAYVEHLLTIVPESVKIFLITLEFEGPSGPPFSVSSDEVKSLFGAEFDIECLDRVEPDDPRDAGRLEVTWLLKRK